MHNISDYTKLDRDIAKGETEAETMRLADLRRRWRFGRMMLDDRNGKRKLPVGRMAELCEATGRSKTELQDRARFAELYNEDQLPMIVGNWTDVKADFPPVNNTPQRKRDNTIGTDDDDETDYGDAEDYVVERERSPLDDIADTVDAMADYQEAAQSILTAARQLRDSSAMQNVRKSIGTEDKSTIRSLTEAASILAELASELAFVELKVAK